MPIPRLRLEHAALLLIDVQEKLMPTIVDADRMVRGCVLAARMAGVLGMPAILTEQNPRALGGTVDALKRELGACQPIEKMRFSAWVPEVRQRLDAAGRSQAIICGIEAHVCVLQTVLDLQAAGLESFLISDAVSAGQASQIPRAIDRMQRAGAVVTGLVSAMYELIADASHPSFRACLPIAKEAAALG